MGQNPKQLNLCKLEKVARKISDPSGYFLGRRPSFPWEPPTDILCFTRRQSDVLNGSGGADGSWQQHHRFVLVVAIGGRGHVCIDAETVRLEEGEALLIFPFQFHSYHSIQPERICWLFCTFQMQATGIELISNLRNSPRALGHNELDLLRIFVGDWQKNAPVRLIQVQLAALLFKFADSRAKRASCVQPPEAGFLAQINLHLLPCLDQPLGIKHLAKVLCSSESQLRKVFRENTGTSLGNHIRYLRITRACSLLHQTSMSIGEVAERCGYDSIYSFSRAFRKSTGFSPLFYRKKHALD